MKKIYIVISLFFEHTRTSITCTLRDIIFLYYFKKWVFLFKKLSKTVLKHPGKCKFLILKEDLLAFASGSIFTQRYKLSVVALDTPHVITVLNFTMNSDQNCFRYRFRIGENPLYIFINNASVTIFQQKQTCIQQGVILCLHRSYICTWKSSPDLFTPTPTFGNNTKKLKWPRIIIKLK